MAHQAVGNQPLILPAPAAAGGGGVAIEVEVLKVTGLNNIPVIQVKASMLPGNVDSPEILFGQGIQDGYATVLQYARRAPNENDTVQIQIHHDGITANGGYWGSGNELDSSTAGSCGKMVGCPAKW